MPTKRTPAKIIAACRTALNLLDTPAAPVGDDADIRLLLRLRGRWTPGELWPDVDAMDEAAARIESQAARIAELEQRPILQHYSDAVARIAELERERSESSTRNTEILVQLASALRQLAAARECIVAADAIYKGYRIAIGTTGATHAYDAARAVLGATPVRRG